MKNFNRTRRLRGNPAIRDMVRETRLSLDDFIYPLFVVEGEGIKNEISSMKGNYHLSVDMLLREVEELLDLGIKSILLFGIPNEKDAVGSQAFSDEGIIQRAVREVKKYFPQMYIITDICMCEYTSHGHCGILNDNNDVDNDKTLEYLGQIAISHARAGADIIITYFAKDLAKAGLVR